MALQEHSFRHLLPTFLIPVGTQVVLKVDKPRADGSIRPRGSVGEITFSPTDNSYAYTVRFADGQEIKARFSELAMRRKEVEDELALSAEDLRPWIIYRCQVGSHAFGLADDRSDEDMRGIYLPPARLHWSLFKLPDHIQLADGSKDRLSCWELEKFLTMAMKANPSALEVLWTPLVVEANDLALRLREMRQAFLTRHLYKTYSGYVLSQFRRMSRAVSTGNQYTPKWGMHLIRLLYSGIDALETGELRMDMTAYRDELLAIKSGAWSFGRVRDKALDLDNEFQEVYRRTRLPEQPDYERVNAFLIEARRRMVDA